MPLLRAIMTTLRRAGCGVYEVRVWRLVGTIGRLAEGIGKRPPLLHATEHH